MSEAAGNLEKTETSNLEKRFAGVDPWQKVGFSRTLGGFFYRYMLFLLEMVIGALLVGFLLNIFYPWPEAEGYRNIVGQLFVLLFSVFDIGTAYGIERFLAEWRVKDPRKMLYYLQFFIWYQMMTGLIQTTLVSMWGLFMVPSTNLAHLIWLILVTSTTQYPGMLGYFAATLKGLQRFDKAQWLQFIHGQFFQMATNVLFILVGRYLGAMFTPVGELMGLAIGAAIGSYVDDFFAMFLGGYFFKKAVKDIFPDLQLRDCFRHEFDRKLVKECLWFGLQVSAGPLFGVFVGQMIALYWINLVPQYSTWIQLASVASGLANVVQWGTGLELVPAISESFLNGKKKLAQFYITQGFRWNLYLAVPLLVMILVYLPLILTVALSVANVSIYLLAVAFLFPYIIAKLLEPFAGFADQVIVGASKPSFLTVVRLLEEAGKLFFMTLWIPWLRVTDVGLPAVVWVMPLGTFIPTFLKTLACWVYIHKKIVPVKFPIGQALIAPGLSSIFVFFISWIYINFIWPPMLLSLTLIPAALLTVLWMLVGTLGIYMFAYGFFGGFDDFGVKIMGEAVAISGPSKPLMKFLMAFLKLGIKISPLHNKFPIPAEDAHREALELMAIREANQKEMERKGT
nr:hypothetical protein [Candidatus Sigynarchaeota archaeon]